jgi:hypothetical protein
MGTSTQSVPICMERFVPSHVVTLTGKVSGHSAQLGHVPWRVPARAVAVAPATIVSTPVSAPR